METDIGRLNVEEEEEEMEDMKEWRRFTTEPEIDLELM